MNSISNAYNLKIEESKTFKKSQIKDLSSINKNSRYTKAEYKDNSSDIYEVEVDELKKRL